MFGRIDGGVLPLVLKHEGHEIRRNARKAVGGMWDDVLWVAVGCNTNKYVCCLCRL